MKKASQREEDDMYVFPNTCMGRTKQWWWYLFEYPSLSLRSRIVAVISFFFVLLSTVVLVVSTLLEDSHRNDPNCKTLYQIPRKSLEDSAQWIRSAGHPASEGENPHTEVYNQMRIKEV